MWLRLRPRHWRRRELLSALAVLQKRFFVSVAGGELTGWSMHRWDIVPRCVPPGLLDALPALAQAQSTLVAAAVRNLVCCRAREVAGLFGWTPSTVAAVAEELVRRGLLNSGVRVAGRPGPHYSRKYVWRTPRIIPHDGSRLPVVEEPSTRWPPPNLNYRKDGLL